MGHPADEFFFHYASRGRLLNARTTDIFAAYDAKKQYTRNAASTQNTLSERK